MFEADITKVVEEMSVRIRETQEDFILDTIFPYCQETLQKKINKAELKQIILRGSRQSGCHQHCKSYIDWKKKHSEEKEKRSREKLLNDYEKDRAKKIRQWKEEHRP